MNSGNVGLAVEVLKGCRVPRIRSVPSYVSSSGPDVVELCRIAGLELDGWQQDVLECGLGEDADGRWAAFEVAMEVARQNGKGEVLLALELGWLFLIDASRVGKPSLILHTAHEFKTSSEAFRRTVAIIESCDLLRSEVASIRRTTGEEGIELRNGNRLRFLARSTSSGRGFSADLVIWDEAQILGPGPVGAMMPTLATRPNPQIWYAGTAGIGAASSHLASVRRRGLTLSDPNLVYLEWSVDENGFDPSERDGWAQANPALGIRISEEYVARELGAMSPQGFASERLGVGDWPTGETFGVIPADAWLACAVPSEERPSPVVFAADATPERSSGAIAVAGRRVDGSVVVEIVEQRPGVDWIADRLLELVDRHDPLSVVVDRSGPAGTAVAALERSNVELAIPASHEVAQAAEAFYDAIMNRSVVHQGDGRLGRAVAGAKQRPIGQAWGWDRRATSDDISPLVAASFALWGFVQADGGEPGVWF